MSRDADWTRFRVWSGTLTDLAGASSLAGWDRETGMPAAGGEGRARMLGTLAAMHHREVVRDDIGEVLERLSEDPGDDAAEAAMVRLAIRDRERALRVPESLVRSLSEASSRCVMTWIEARPADDVDSWCDALAPLVDLTRERARALAADGGEPYDALLDEFEPGATAAQLEPLFAELREGLAPILEAAAGHGRPLPAARWDRDAQMDIAHLIGDLVGFDRESGAIAQSAHPFTCSPHVGDVRFTTRTREDDPIGNVTAVMHEAGHALYDQGMPAEHAGTPVHAAPSLGAHESQSRFWENHIGRTRAFWSLMTPHMQAAFPDAMAGLDEDALYHAATFVEPSFIRVEADEVTYNLHVILRFELELALIRGDLAVADLPDAWNAKMETLLGIVPATHTDGVMQDIHWPEGMFGYFPTYTLGSIYAAQLAEAAERELGPLEDLAREGEFDGVLAFLRDRVHRHGATLSAQDLIGRATGLPQRPDELLSHLRRAYTA